MKQPEPMVWRLYGAATTAITALIAHRLISQAWRLATGEQPPDPNDPAVPFGEAAAWMISIGVGAGVAQLGVNRHLRRRWQAYSAVPSRADQ